MISGRQISTHTTAGGVLVGVSTRKFLSMETYMGCSDEKAEKWLSNSAALHTWYTGHFYQVKNDGGFFSTLVTICSPKQDLGSLFHETDVNIAL